MFIHYDDNAIFGYKVMHYSVIIIKKGVGEGSMLTIFRQQLF